MDGALLADRLSRGMGAAARAFGEAYDAFRPLGTVDPLRVEGRFLRLPAVLDGGDPGFRRPTGYERALRGTFDVAYLRVGDLLQGPRGVLFVVMLPPLNRPLCVLANAVAGVVRPSGPGLAGLGGYGGADAPELVMDGWPAQILAAGAGRGFGLPEDGGLGGFHVLLPLGAPAARTGDHLRDGAGRGFVVGGVELSELGWRLHVRQVGA